MDMRGKIASPGKKVGALVRTWITPGAIALTLVTAPTTAVEAQSLLTLIDTNGRELGFGETQTSALSAADVIGLSGEYMEAWALSAQEGQSVTLDVMSDDFDSYLYVIGPGMTEALQDDDSGGACHARISFTALESGMYHVVATSAFGPQPGTYEIRASNSPGETPEWSCGGIDPSAILALTPQGQVALHDRVTGRLSGSEQTIQDGRPLHAWQIRGVRGETVAIGMESDDFDSFLYVTGPGLEGALTDDDSGGNLHAQVTVTFPEDGVYTIGAAALSSGSTGSYVLSVTEPLDLADLETDGRTLELGATANGALNELDPIVEGRPVQAWAFSAHAGQRVTIDLISEAFDSYLQVVGPGLATPLVDDDGGEGLNSSLVLTFPETGSYRIIAGSLGGDHGPYSLRIM